MQVKLQHLEKPVDIKDFDQKSKSKSTFSVDVPFSVPKTSTCNVKVVSHESPVKAQLQEEEEAYEGEDEHEKDYFNSDHHHNRRISIGKTPIQEQDEYIYMNMDNHQNNSSDIKMDDDGHLSDPKATKTPFLVSPKLKQSCSNLEMKRVLMTNRIVPCESFEDL